MKKLIPLLLALLLCLTAAQAETSVLTWDFEDGQTASYIQSGNCSIGVTDKAAHGGSRALAVTRRTANNWDAVDLTSASIGLKVGVPAKVTAWVYVDSEEEGTFVIAKSKDDYATLGSVNCPGRQWTQVTAEFTLTTDANLRFQNLSANWNGADYYIDDVTVELTVPEAVTAEEAFTYASDFSAGTDGWYARSAGGAEVSLTSEGGLLITGRSATWNSPGRDFPLTTGHTYNLKVLVKQDQVDSVNFILSIAHKRGSDESYENLCTAAARKGEWTLLQATYVAGQYDTYVFYIEGGNPDSEYQIRDFVCEEQTMAYGKAGIPSLKEVYAPYFDFGTAVVASELLDADRMDFYKSQFNIFTPGNEMKPDYLLSIAGCKSAVKKTGDQTAVSVKFDTAAPLLRWARDNGVKVHGHTLIWHSQTPKAFFHVDYSTSKPLVSREVMLGRMENYIRQVLEWTEEKYPGVIVSWDVVNEAVADGSSKLRDSLWTQVVGDDFVNRAFEYARKYAAPGVELYYNDYNSENTMKAVGIRKLVKSLLEDGTLDGYGFQSHYTAGETNLFYVKVAWKEMAKMTRKDGTPIKLRVSELDVGIPANTEDAWQTQARFYKDLMKIYLEYADQLVAVHTWGTVDNLSWRADKYPLLFDGLSQPKPAFYALVD